MAAQHKEERMRYYIAYGSNLNKEQMMTRCPHARVVGTAEIKDYRLLFKGSHSGAYLTIEKTKGYSVPVGIWEVDESDERNLDRYEGFPVFYYKENMKLPVTDENGNTEEKDCFVYIMHEDRKLGLPSPYYEAICARGYEAFGFDLESLLEAYEYTAKHMRKGKNDREDKSRCS